MAATTALLFFVAYCDCGTSLCFVACFITRCPNSDFVPMLKSASRRWIVLSFDSSLIPGTFSSSTFSDCCQRIGEYPIFHARSQSNIVTFVKYSDCVAVI